MNQEISEHADRIKLPLIFDTNKLLEEINAFNLDSFVYYNVVPLRSPAHLVDSSLPFPPPADDYADGSWTEWMNTPELESSPYLKQIIESFNQHTRVTLVRVLRLAAGQVVDEHTDPTLGLHIERSVIRLTIPVLVNDNVQFFLNGEHVPMKPGECWYLRLTDPHKVVNHSAEDRISISIDMAPNDWVRSLIQGKETLHIEPELRNA